MYAENFILTCGDHKRLLVISGYVNVFDLLVVVVRAVVVAAEAGVNVEVVFDNFRLKSATQPLHKSVHSGSFPSNSATVHMNNNW